MISLSSCTMTLNTVASLAPCIWPDEMDSHSFTPAGGMSVRDDPDTSFGADSTSWSARHAPCSTC